MCPRYIAKSYICVLLYDASAERGKEEFDSNSNCSIICSRKPRDSYRTYRMLKIYNIIFW